MTVRAVSSVTFLAEELREKKIPLVGVVGPAGLDARGVELQEPYFKAFLTELRRLLEDPACAVKDICIVNNGTSAGIPGMVVRLAHTAGFPLLGVCPKIGAEQRLIRSDLLTWLAIKGKKWGDEEESIVECISALVILGGQFGTLSLLTDLMNRNDHRVKEGGVPVAVFPFSPLPVSSLVGRFVEQFLVKELGAEELSKLGLAAVTASPTQLAQSLMEALVVRISI